MKEIYDIAIIGGGPGGIGSAVESVILGIKDVILFEKGENHSTTIRKFYKDNKRVDKDYKGQKVELNGNIYFCDGTKESTLDLFDEIIAKNNFEAQFQTEVESIKKEGEYFLIHTTQNTSIKAKFIVISIGKMGQPNKPSYPIPSTIRSVVNFNANSCQNNEKILVVGGGNSAVEYACVLSDTNPVMLNYRRTEFSRINETNKENLNACLEAGKITPKLGIDIVSLEDENGKPKVNFTDGTSETFDRVVYAIGGMAPVDFLKKCNLALDDNGVPLIDENHQSSIDKIYIAGDILYKNGGSIAAALNHGFHIVQEIKKRL
ncbi:MULTISPECIES: NAD(P)-binding domain-containing protein [Helicobacter]|uniref:NAD(P)-binding domain-containing protein n=1 Tax=Helicobacter colisuis TaxID=2949739 RepID=A0ABT0TUW3_9HELI|nr:MULTISPECIES: NAD(P)-binding domain-containing protein [Helicobacter]MCI2236459.1 NAD(P)-binding domain-containing protein [Helicobacter sp. CaF467b]MCI7048015.1 NAD(P)-binding domain-containing protein [Helicobacter sp.]MCL9819253.1 NAD(P)-binding domain-containing protein [Helicobacter colisuis]MCL9821743.1 NAD(P)-binding domain-containing protein [Helicobacter colisuis]MCL9822619.1 NAD(P)-binding domain-containing protein [Helicobacter colisuis]